MIPSIKEETPMTYTEMRVNEIRAQGGVRYIATTHSLRYFREHERVQAVYPSEPYIFEVTRKNGIYKDIHDSLGVEYCGWTTFVYQKDGDFSDEFIAYGTNSIGVLYHTKVYRWMFGELKSSDDHPEYFI